MSFGGSSYVALAANVGRQPDVSPTFWAVLAQAGTPGAAGSDGSAGAGGCAGAVGVTYRGTWAAATAYHANDVVVFNGATYLGTTTSLGSRAGCVAGAVGGAGGEWGAGRDRAFGRCGDGERGDGDDGSGGIAGECDQ